MRFLAGEREAADVRARPLAGEEKGAFLDGLTDRWGAGGRAANQPMTERAWRALDARIRQDQPPAPVAVRSASAGRGSARPLRSARLLAYRVAALMGVGAAGVVLVLRMSSTVPGAMPEAEVFTTWPGQRATIRLEDGTRVRLNADSRLTVASGFAFRAREVQLDGQAFFDVAVDRARPLVLRTGFGTLRAVGTAFDVSAYPEAGRMQVVVASGEVALYAKARGPEEAVLLRSRDLGLVSEAGGQWVRRGVQIGRYLAWTEGRLVLEDASFEEVARQLERWYDLRIELEAPAQDLGGLRASFAGAPLHEILDAVSAAHGLRYVRDGRKITFYVGDERERRLAGAGAPRAP